MGQKSEVLIRGPFLGLNTRKDALLLDPREASDCDNVVLDGDSIQMRKYWVEHTNTDIAAVELSDNFNRADAATLTGGGIWAQTETNATTGIVSNEAKSQITGVNGNTTVTHQTTIGINQIVTVTVRANAGITSYFGICLRVTDADNYYFIKSNGDGTVIGKRVAGTESTISTHPTVLLASPFFSTTNVTVTAVIIGDTILFYSGGSYVMGGKDTGITSGNLCGMVCRGGSNGDGANYHYFDNFIAEKVPGPFGFFSFNDAATPTTIRNVAKINNGLRAISHTATAGSIGTGLKEGTVPSFAMMNNRLYIADGVATPQANDGLAMFNAKLAAPVAAPTLALGTSTGLTGEYDYKYTYYADAWGLESPASPVSAKVTPDGKSVTVTMVVSSDARSDNHRIYRRKVSAGETKWSLVEEVAEGTSYTDDSIDEDVDTDRSAPFSSSANLPAFEHLSSYRNRMFWSGGATNKDRLYFSETDRPGTVTDENDNWIRVGGEDETEPITSHVAILDSLVIFKKRSIYVLMGDSIDNFVLNKVTSNLGCVSHGSIAVADDIVYFAGENGIYSFDLNTITEISKEISVTYNNRILEADSLMVSATDKNNGFIVWSLYGKNQSLPGTQLVYFYRYSMEVGKHCFTKWTTTCISALYFGLSNITRKNELFWGGYDGGKPYWGVYGGSEGGTGVIDVASTDFQWTTGKIDFGSPSKNKHWGEIVTQISSDAVTGGSDNVVLSYLLPDDTSTTAAGTTAIAGANLDASIREKISRRSRNIRLQVKLTNPTENKRFRINSIGLNGVVLGRGS